MNPLLFRPEEDALGGLLAGMTPQEAGNLAGPGLNAAGGLLSGLAAAAPGSLRRAWEGSDLRQNLQGALNTASYYAGPHLSNRVEAVASALPQLTPNFGTSDAQAAGDAFQQGQYGKGAGLMGLGVAGGLLDALPGEAAAKGILKGLTKAAHYTPDLSMAIAPIKAFHGSPHDFDRFDISKIGSGEGAQAYGHGLYFAGNEDVARSYRDALSARNVQKNSPEDLAAKALTYAGNDPQRAAQRIRDQLGEWRSAPPSMRGSLDEAKFQDALALVRGGQPIGGGRMYEVGIHADPERFLDWDKPLSEQAAPVQKALAKLDVGGERAIPYGEMRDSFLDPMRAATKGTDIGRFLSPEAILTGKADMGEVRKSLAADPERLAKVNDLLASYNRRSSLRGSDAYHSLARTYENDVTGLTSAPRSVEASEQLRDLGVPGLRYLDAGSRGAAGEGSRNYVTFSDDIVQILRKYGLAGLGLGVPATMAMQPGLFPLPQQQQ